MERHTKQKELVYAALRSPCDHPTAEQVYDRVHTDHPHVSKATVYRILRNMAEKGEITRVPVANGADHFDHTLQAHFHICCDLCGRVEDIFDSGLDAVIRRAAGRSDFRATGYELLFHGVCAQCQEKETACP